MTKERIRDHRSFLASKETKFVEKDKERDIKNLKFWIERGKQSESRGHFTLHNRERKRGGRWAFTWDGKDKLISLLPDMSKSWKPSDNSWQTYACPRLSSQFITRLCNLVWTIKPHSPSSSSFNALAGSYYCPTVIMSYLMLFCIRVKVHGWTRKVTLYLFIYWPFPVYKFGPNLFWIS